MGGVSHRVGLGNQTQGPLEEQPVHFTTEPSLQLLATSTPFKYRKDHHSKFYPKKGHCYLLLTQTFDLLGDNEGRGNARQG